MSLLSDTVDEGITFLSCLSTAFVHLFVCSSRQILLPRYFMNGSSSHDETYIEYSLAPTDDPVIFWRSKVTAGRRGVEEIRRQHQSKLFSSNCLQNFGKNLVASFIMVCGCRLWSWTPSWLICSRQHIFAVITNLVAAALTIGRVQIQLSLISRRTVCGNCLVAAAERSAYDHLQPFLLPHRRTVQLKLAPSTTALVTASAQCPASPSPSTRGLSDSPTCLVWTHRQMMLPRRIRRCS